MSDIMIETLLPDFSNLCEIGLCPNRRSEERRVGKECT